MITAGETSGDLLGAGLAGAIREISGDAELLGMGGEAMARAGVRLVQDSRPLSVVGLVEVLAHLPEIRAAMKRLRTVIREEKPDILIPVDFPDFNLRLASYARSCGVRVVYFVSPQVWAWRKRRIRKIREIVDHMLVLFPFEASFYETAQVPVTFVGHPVVERLPADGDGELLGRVLAEGGLDPAGPTVALVPGSRRGEIGRILPPLLGAARLLERQRPDLQFLLSRAPGIDPDWLARQTAGSGLKGLVVHGGRFPEVLRGCRAGVVASGTATLEAAMTGLPMVVVYRMNRLSYLLGKLMVQVDHVAMPNLVACRRVLPELIQGDCTAERIAAELGDLMDSPERSAEIRTALSGIRNRLQGEGAYRRAAEVVLNHWNP
jgi:lipid-A-disaccharide synthase